MQVVQNGEKKSYEIPTDRRIIVLEDIDCLTDMVLDRADPSTAEVSQASSGMHALNLSILLNILDGILEQPGRILFMTSNFPDKLDKALVRPGRIDVIVRFTCYSAQEISEIVHGFTGKGLSECDQQRVRPLVWTLAEVTQVIFEHLEDIESIVAKLEGSKEVAPEDPPKAHARHRRVQECVAAPGAHTTQPNWASMF